MIGERVQKMLLRVHLGEVVYYILLSPLPHGIVISHAW